MQNLTTVYLILNTDNISRTILLFLYFFFYPQLFKLTEEVIIRSSDDGILFLLGNHTALDHFPLFLKNQLAQTLSVSSDIH